MVTTPPPVAPASARDHSAPSTASTYDWDTVCAIPVPRVNAAIVAAGSTPAGFTAVPSGGSSPVKGTFEAWRVCRGGDGKNLRMTTPMSSVTIGRTTFRDVSTTIEIKLALLPHTDATPPPAGVLRKLVPRTTTDDPAADPVVVVDEAVESTPSMGILEKATFQVAFRQWANENLAQFTHIFAVVNVDGDIDSDAQWAFATPSYVEYAVLDGATVDDGVFAVLCMTGGRSGSALTPQVSPNAIPGRASGGFLLSPTRYLSDLLRPALVHCYPGLTPELVELSADASSMALAPHKVVRLQAVTHESKTYQPRLTALEISVLGQVLTIDSATETEVAPGVTALTRATHWYRLTLVDHPDGGQTLRYVAAQPAVVKHWTHQSTGVVVAEVVVGVITVIGVVIAGVLTAGAAFVVAALVIGALGGLAAAAPAIVALVNEDRSPSIDALVLNVSGPIVWPGSADFTLVQAGLNESLQLGGNLHFRS